MSIPQLKNSDPSLIAALAIYMGFRGKIVPLKTLHNGVNSPHYVAVLDPIMGIVITEMQGSFAVETRAWALRFAIEMMLDAGFEPCVLALLWYWDVGVELCWDTGFEPRILALQWYWDVGFKPHVFALQWYFRVSHFDIVSMIFMSLASEEWALNLTTYLQWFLDSLQNPPPKFSKLRGWMGQVLKHFGLIFW